MVIRLYLSCLSGLGCELNYIQGRLGDHFPGQFIGVPFTVDYPGYTGIDDHFSADDARHGGAVQCGTIDICAVLGGLDNGILFSVQTTAEFVAFAGRYLEPFTETAYRLAVGNPGRNTVVPGCQDIAILDQ
jgi:hypothetical protein